MSPPPSANSAEGRGSTQRGILLSTIVQFGGFTVARRSEGTNSGDMLAQAQEFLELFHREVPSAGSYERRWAQVRQNIEKTGSYWHTHRELAFGARVAWRHS